MIMDETFDPFLLTILGCPIDHGELFQNGCTLMCSQGHRYPIFHGIPVLLIPSVTPTKNFSHNETLVARGDCEERNWRPCETDSIHPVVQMIVAAAGGYLYKDLVGKLHTYPIPDLRLPCAENKELLLDVGCNWARWTIAAARKGYTAIGVDPDIGALMAARIVAAQLGVRARYIAGDARYPPFRSRVFDLIFSYSVIQHFSKDDARVSIKEMQRMLRVPGKLFIQMPNKFGLRSGYHQLRKFRKRTGIFDVRYWSPRELKETFSALIGPTQILVDGYFGLGIQPSDRDVVPWKIRPVIYASECMRKLQRLVPPLLRVADSLYVSSCKVS